VTGRHLGERIHDLLDNRLPRPAAAEAMAHLSECEECATRWHELRSAREALHSSEAGIDMRFTSRLLDRNRMAEIASHETRRDVRAARGRDRRPVVLSLSLAAAAGAVVGAAYVAGTPAEVDPTVAAASYAGNVSLVSYQPSEISDGEVPDRWAQPDWESTVLEPLGASERIDPNGHRMFVLTMEAGDHRVVVTEQRGRLDPACVAEAPRITVDGVDFYQVETSPLRVVWQAGAVVATLTCDCTWEALEEVAEQFPQDGEPGFADQVMSGMSVITAALTGAQSSGK